MRSRRLPQNRKRALLNGSSLSCPLYYHGKAVNGTPQISVTGDEVDLLV